MVKENTRITKVRLLLDKCLIEREAGINLSPGVNRIILEPLEPIDDIVAIMCSEGRILSYQFKNISKPKLEVLSEEVSKIIEKQKSLLRSIHLLEGEKMFLESEVQGILVSLKKMYVAYMKENIRHGITKSLKTDISILDGQVKYLHKRLSDKKKKIFEIDMQLEKLKNELKALLNNLDELRRDIVNVGKIELLIESEHEQKTMLNVKFLSSIASWRPKYRLYVDNNETILSHLIVLEQRSPLVWREIDLEITTLKPTKVQYVEPKPWFIQPMRPQVLPQRVPKKRARHIEEMAMEESAPPPEAEPKPVRFVEVVEEFEGVVTFRLSKKSTILPNEPMVLDAFIAKIVPEFYYVWDAFKNDSVIEIIEFENKGVCILGGHCDVFIGGILVNSFNIEYLPVGAKIKWVLKEEPNIKVSKKLVKRDEKTKGLISEKACIDMMYELEVENRLGKETNIKIYDRVPKPRDPKIEVKVKLTEPKASISEVGIVEWNIKLEPESKKTLRIAYTIYFPPEYRLPI